MYQKIALFFIFFSHFCFVQASTSLNGLEFWDKSNRPVNPAHCLKDSIAINAFSLTGEIVLKEDFKLYQYWRAHSTFLNDSSYMKFSNDCEKHGLSTVEAALRWKKAQEDNLRNASIIAQQQNNVRTAPVVESNSSCCFWPLSSRRSVLNTRVHPTQEQN